MLLDRQAAARPELSECKQRMWAQDHLQPAQTALVVHCSAFCYQPEAEQAMCAHNQGTCEPTGLKDRPCPSMASGPARA